MSDVATLKYLKRQLGACEDTIRTQKTIRKSLLRQIADAREDAGEGAFGEVFPEVVAAEAKAKKG